MSPFLQIILQPNYLIMPETSARQRTIAEQTPKRSSPSFINNPRNRSVFYQTLLLLGLGYFFYVIVANTLANMEARGIKSGYGFLTETAGFDILMSLIPYDATYTYAHTFLAGLLNTLLVSAISIVLCTALGFLMGIANFSQNWLIRKTAVVYVETFRNIPLLLQVFFWYFAVLATLPSARESLQIAGTIFLNVRGLYLPALIGEPGAGLVYGALVSAILMVYGMKIRAKRRQDLTGEQFPLLRYGLVLVVGLPLTALIFMDVPFSWSVPAFKGFNFQGGITVIPELMALAMALTVYTGAFIAEAVRAGLQSVPPGQTEAARSLGLKERRIMSLVVVPQAMQVIVPLLNSEYQSLVKNSTLATAIGYPGLFSVFAGTALNQTGQAIEIILMTMAVYFVVNMAISFVMNRFNSRVSLSER